MCPQSHIDCERARAWMVEDLMGEGRTEDEAAGHQHLASCPGCRQYRQVLLGLGRSTAAEGRRTPAPAAALESLRAAVRARRRPRYLWPAVRQLLQVRVPAYQALLGAAAAVVLLFAARPGGPPSRLSISAPGAPPAAATPVTLTRADSHRVDQMLRRLERQDRGPGLDTLLSRYLARQVAGSATGTPPAAM